MSEKKVSRREREFVSWTLWYTELEPLKLFTPVVMEREWFDMWEKTGPLVGSHVSQVFPGEFSSVGVLGHMDAIPMCHVFPSARRLVVVDGSQGSDVRKFLSTRPARAEHIRHVWLQQNVCEDNLDVVVSGLAVNLAACNLHMAHTLASNAASMVRPNGVAVFIYFDPRWIHNKYTRMDASDITAGMNSLLQKTKLFKRRPKFYRLLPTLKNDGFFSGAASLYIDRPDRDVIEEAMKGQDFTVLSRTSLDDIVSDVFKSGLRGEYQYARAWRRCVQVVVFAREAGRKIQE
jgi:hypothetical protein